MSTRTSPACTGGEGAHELASELEVLLLLNPINADGRFVYAAIEHQYKHGGTRESDRRFHPACFEKFEQQGRPYNPDNHVVLSSELLMGSGGGR